MEAERQPVAATIRVGDQLVEFQSVACNLCGAVQQELVFSGEDRSLRLPGRFTVVRCVKCGLLRQNPQPTQLTIGAYYPPNYEPYSPALDSEAAAWRRWDRQYGMVKRRRLVERFQPAGTLLDVGCATGGFLAEMTRHSRWRVVGIEPNAGAAQRAIEHLELDVRVGRVEDIELSDATFDVITLWNVVEHLNAPVDALRRLVDRLKPGGIVVFSLPNLESYEAQLFGDRWFFWELPRHLYFFPRPVVYRLLADLDLQLLSRVCLSGSQLGLAESLKYLYSERTNKPRWNDVASRLITSSPGRMLLAPAFKVISLLRQGYVVTYVARKT